jgi:hypothetical protein
MIFLEKTEVGKFIGGDGKVNFWKMGTLQNSGFIRSFPKIIKEYLDEKCR